MAISNALHSPEEMVKIAIKKGLDGIAITDHDTVKGSLVAKKYAKGIKNFKVITGTEIRCRDGEVLAYGITKDVKPKMNVIETVEKIHDLGGIAVAPHPFSGMVSRNCLGKNSNKTDGVEVFNAGGFSAKADSMAKAFAKKHKMPVSAGSDAHCAQSIGNAGIICDGDPLEAIMKKKVKIFGKYTNVFVVPYIVMMNVFTAIGLRKRRQTGSL